MAKWPRAEHELDQNYNLTASDQDVPDINMALQDFLIAGRVLRKSPVFTLAAVLTIALGVGASTAIFSVTNAVLLQPLPYKSPDQLVIAGMELRRRNVRDLPLSNADFIDLRNGTKAVFDDMAGVRTGPALVPLDDGTTEQVRVAIVTTNFFQMAGARVVLGRSFSAEDGTPQPPAPPGADADATPPVRLPVIAILSYEYFQRRYGGNPDVLGRTVQTTGGPGFVIVGAVGPGFRLYFPPESNVEPAPDFWVANRLNYEAADRTTFTVHAIGKLKDGVSVNRAQSAADAVASDARKKFPLWQASDFRIQIEPMRQHLVRAVQPAILALMGAVIFLLIIACANVANLLLVRASLREIELATRAALGASLWRQVRPFLLEAALLAFMGTVAGVGLAWAGIRELRALAPANLPLVDNIRMDIFVLGFSAFVGLAAAIVFGLAPAWHASRPDLMNVLRLSSRTFGSGGGRILRNLVVMAEVALSFVLLVGSGLMFRSFLDLRRVDPGFDERHLLTFKLLGVPAIGKTTEARAALVRQIKDRLASIPGIQSVSASFPFPLSGNFTAIRWGTGEALSDSSKFQATDHEFVLPGYFETVRAPLLAGRTFTEDDNLPGRNGVMIDQVLANKAFPGQSAVGKRILIRIRTPEPEWVEVLGVIAHQHATSLTEPGREQVYFTDAFAGYGQVRSWVLRTGNDPSGYMNEVRSAVRQIDPQLVVTEMEPVESLVLHAQSGTRFSLLLISVFAVIAGVLAGVGLYGVVATAVRQRTFEIGVRMALGAERRNIFQLIVGQGLRLSAAGIVAGLIAAFFLTRALSAMLVGVKPTDPLTFAGITVMFFAIAALASWLPARRAAGLNPTTALREQ